MLGVSLSIGVSKSFVSVEQAVAACFVVSMNLGSGVYLLIVWLKPGDFYCYAVGGKIVRKRERGRRTRNDENVRLLPRVGCGGASIGGGLGTYSSFTFEN